MEEKEINRHLSEGTLSNIIFGTSSDDIQQGLDNEQFIDMEQQNVDDKDQIVNEQEQNEIINPSEETFNEELIPPTIASDNATANPDPNQLEENVIDLDPDEAEVDKSGKISKAED